MSAATIFDAGRSGGRRRPFTDLFAGGGGDVADGGSDGPPAPTAPALPHPADQPQLSDYLDGLERGIERAQRTQVRETLVEVTPREVQRVVEKAAKAKARYLALVLDMAEHEGLPEAKQIETLAAARHRYDTMQAGVDALMAAMRAGQIKVSGVMPDARGDGTPR